VDAEASAELQSQFGRLSSLPVNTSPLLLLSIHSFIHVRTYPSEMTVGKSQLLTINYTI